MAEKDGYVEIGTKIDEGGLDKGLAGIASKLKTGLKSADSFLGSFAKFSVIGAGAALAFKKVADTINDLTDAYKDQRKAEIQLEAAAKNNPYLDDSSVAALKEYAAQLGNIAGIGDQELLPYMAQLATAGRTQAQIQEIMAVAVDASASGAMSLDSAVRNLNKTYGGLAGELGETVPELRGLTAEEMKQGAAVKLLGERYKGMAAEVAKGVGSSQALDNAFTNLKEKLGKPFESALGAVRGFFANIINGWNESIDKMDKYKKAKKLLHDADEEGADMQISAAEILAAQLTVEQKKLEDIEKEYKSITSLAESEKQAYGTISKTLSDQVTEIIKKREAQWSVISGLQEEEKLQASIAKADADAAAAQTARDALNAKAAAHIAKVTAAREAAIQQIKLQADAEGKEADQLEIINAYVASYVSLISESEGAVTVSNGTAIKLLSTVKEMVGEYDAINAALDANEKRIAAAKELEKERLEKAQKAREEAQAALDAIQEAVPDSEKMRGQLAVLDSLQEAAINNEQITVDEKLAIQEEYFSKRKILLDQIEAAEKEEAAAEVADRRAKTVELLEIVNTFAQQYQQIMADIQSLVSHQIEDEEKVKTAELQKQYEAGAISAEEYEEKLTEIKRQAAKEKYKIDMWAWAANVAAAVGNTALAATKALADGGGWLGAALAAGIIAAGGVQLASLISAKPIPPAFATGGIVPGTSYSGDKVLSRLDSGEMVWNVAQQKALWDKVQSGDWGNGNGARVQVYNSAANVVRTDAAVDEDGIRIAIRQVVSKDMADGRFNAPMRKAQQGMRGTRYTN